MFHGILSGDLLPDLLGEPDENPFGTPNVAEPIDILVIDDFIDHRRAVLAEPGEGVVEVLDGSTTQVSHEQASIPVEGDTGLRGPPVGLPPQEVKTSAVMTPAATAPDAINTGDRWSRKRNIGLTYQKPRGLQLLVELTQQFRLSSSMVGPFPL